MYGDTITVTINSVAKAMSKINQDSYSSEYFLKESLGEFRLKIRHSNDRVSSGSKKRDRHTVTLTQTIYATSTVPEYQRQTTVTVVGNFDDTAADQAYNVVGLEAWLNQANAVKLINWES